MNTADINGSLWQENTTQSRCCIKIIDEASFCFDLLMSNIMIVFDTRYRGACFIPAHYVVLNLILEQPLISNHLFLKHTDVSNTTLHFSEYLPFAALCAICSCSQLAEQLPRDGEDAFVLGATRAQRRGAPPLILLFVLVSPWLVLACVAGATGSWGSRSRVSRTWHSSRRSPIDGITDWC